MVQELYKGNYNGYVSLNWVNYSLLERLVSLHFYI